METALLGLQEELKLTNKSSALKEVKILKKVVQSLEEELTKERSKNQRVSNKRLQESRHLADEVSHAGTCPCPETGLVGRVLLSWAGEVGALKILYSVKFCAQAKNPEFYDLEILQT